MVLTWIQNDDQIVESEDEKKADKADDVFTDKLIQVAKKKKGKATAGSSKRKEKN